MKAMILNEITDLKFNKKPLELTEVETPVPGENELLLKVFTCGVCHTELDEIEGRTEPAFLPLIPGHQIVGRVVDFGNNVRGFKTGDRVGVGWIYSSCGVCSHCKSGNDNLCDEFKATGRDVNGGYAEYMTVPEGFAFHIPEVFSDSVAAPLLCAGAIGFRSLNLTNISNGQTLGLTGFGASAHLVLKIAKYKFPETKLFVFARSEKERKFALDLGAYWAGDTIDKAPEKLDAVIDTTPVWKPVVEALINLAPNGRLVINAVRKEDHDKNYLMNINYPEHLWMEKEIKSVANVSRSDISGFLQLASEIPVKPEVQEFSLEEANKAIIQLKEGIIRGAKVLRTS